MTSKTLGERVPQCGELVIATLLVSSELDSVVYF